MTYRRFAFSSVFTALSLGALVSTATACKQASQPRNFATGGAYKFDENRGESDANSSDATSVAGNSVDDGDRILTGKPVEPEIDTEDDEDFTPVGNKGPGKYDADFQTSNDFFTRMDGPLKGNSPHGTVQIWYSSNLLTMVRRPAFEAPVGTVAIKKYKNDDGEGIVTMIKKEKGYDRDNNDWRYEVRDKDGTLLTAPKPGKIGTCIVCHAAAEDTDYLPGTNFGVATDDNDQENEEDEEPANSGDAPEGPGQFQKDFALKDTFFTETKSFYNGNSPHGRVRIWYSSNIKNLIGNAKFIAPEGTVAIKEFDNDDDEGVDGVAVMIKMAPGFDSDNNDWHYEMRDQWGVKLTTPEPGPNAQCSSCHGAAADTDYLPGTKISTGAVETGGPGPGKFKADYYSSALFFSRMTNMHEGNSPHGKTRIWYSTNLKELSKERKFLAPTGTVAVTRFENGDDQGLAVMIKQAAGYDSAHGDWRYEMRDRYGNLLTKPKPGLIEKCVKCHSKAEKTDYLGGTRLEN